MTDPTPLSSGDILDALKADIVSGVEEKQVGDMRKRMMDPSKRYDLAQKIRADEEMANGPFVKLRFRSRHF